MFFRHHHHLPSEREVIYEPVKGYDWSMFDTKNVIAVFSNIRAVMLLSKRMFGFAHVLATAGFGLHIIGR